MRQRQPKGTAGERSIVRPAVILAPCRMGRVLVEILRADVVVLTAHHAPQPAEKALDLIGADAVQRVRFRVVETPLAPFTMMQIAASRST